MRFPLFRSEKFGRRIFLRSRIIFHCFMIGLCRFAENNGKLSVEKIQFSEVS